MSWLLYVRTKILRNIKYKEIMRKRFKAKVSGVFDIVQLSDATFSEVRDKLKDNNYQIDQQFTSREECLAYIQEHSNEPNLGIIP